MTIKSLILIWVIFIFGTFIYNIIANIWIKYHARRAMRDDYPLWLIFFSAAVCIYFGCTIAFTIYWIANL